MGTVYQLVADLATGTAYKDSHRIITSSKAANNGEGGIVKQIRLTLIGL